MTITEKALADLLLKYFTTLEPVGKDVTLKNEMKKVAQPDGSTKATMVPKKGDAYIPKDLSKSMSLAIAKAIHPNLLGGIQVYRKATGNVAVSGTISPWAPTFLSALQTTIVAQEGDFADVTVGSHDLEVNPAGVISGYIGFNQDGTGAGSQVKSVHVHHEPAAIHASPANLTWTIGPLSAGNHIIYPWSSRYDVTSNNFSCRFPWCHIRVYPGTERQG